MFKKLPHRYTINQLAFQLRALAEGKCNYNNTMNAQIFQFTSASLHTHVRVHVGQQGHGTLLQAAELLVHPGKADEVPSGAFYVIFPHT